MNNGTTYFKRKTHLHDPLTLIAPPKSGPNRKDKAIVDVAMLEYLGYLSIGTSSDMMTILMAYTPDPPIP